MKKLDNPDVVITDVMTMQAKWQADKPALIMGDKVLTWREFNERINKVANGLIHLGLRKGETVGLLAHNRLEVPEIIFGVVKAGGVIVPLSTMLREDAIARMLLDAGAKFLFVDAKAQGLIAEYRQNQAGIPGQNIFSIDDQGDGLNSYSDLLRKNKPENPDVRISYDDPFNIMYTSGTTGMPKGILHTHHGRYNFTTMFGLIARIDSTATTILSTALYTNGTWLLLLPTLFSGGTVVIMQQFEVGEFIRSIEAYKCTHTFMVPTQYLILLEQLKADRPDLSSMRTWLSAGSSFRKEVKKQLLQTLEGDLVDAYGCTEGVTTVLRPEAGEDKIDSVGLPPVGWDVRIIDDRDGELPPEGVGEIVGRTSFMMSEYYKLPQLTAEAIWEDERGRTYIRTGDVGKLDKDGYLYILDRKKDIIISGGINIFANDIEEILARHESVEDAAVIAVPHEKWGETPLALVRLKQDAQIDEDTLKSWLNDRLGKYQRVSAVVFYEAPFPRNALGKLLKRQLREMYWPDPETPLAGITQST